MFSQKLQNMAYTRNIEKEFIRPVNNQHRNKPCQSEFKMFQAPLTVPYF